MKIVLMLAHSVEEYAQVRLLSELGYEVFSIGAYIDPAKPGDNLRPALPNVPFYPELERAVQATPTPTGDHLWAAKDRLPEDVLEWGDTFICHHIEWRWLLLNWPRLRAAGKRVIWRTVGQSTTENELRMKPLRDEGLEVVRYSPREEHIPGYIGSDALIRFYVDGDELGGWTGSEEIVGNVTQAMAERNEWTGFSWWLAATRGLRAVPAGPKSEEIGGLGRLSYTELLEYLRTIRAYLYTGTFPASLTLGLLEALAIGTPVVAAPPDRWARSFPTVPYGHLLYEAHEIAPLAARDPDEARELLRTLLRDLDFAKEISERGRASVLATFGRDVVAEQWKRFLG